MIVQGVVARGPAPPPLADGDGLHLAEAGGPRVAEAGLLGQQANQPGPLVELKRGGSAAGQAAGVAQEVRGEQRLMEGGWSGHWRSPAGARDWIPKLLPPTVREHPVT
jgi:hypothetical protein